MGANVSGSQWTSLPLLLYFGYIAYTYFKKKKKKKKKKKNYRTIFLISYVSDFEFTQQDTKRVFQLLRLTQETYY